MDYTLDVFDLIGKRVTIGKQKYWKLRDISVTTTKIPPRNISTKQRAFFILGRSKSPTNECRVKIVVNQTDDLHATINDNGTLTLHLDKKKTVSIENIKLPVDTPPDNTRS